MKSLASQALEPYRVLDLTHTIGWTCGKLLADLGADVIKIEPPGGDLERRIGPFYGDVPHPERNLSWFVAHTNQRGITLNLDAVDGQALWRELAREADFVVESFPPGFMDQLGLGFRQLSELNPRLIWTSITPFGQSGPYAHYRASDLVGMAMGGLMYVCGDADRPPVRLRPAQAYLQAGLQGAVATLLAHHYRVRSGEGQFIDVSMQHAVSWAIIPTRQYWDLNRLMTERGGTSRAFGDQLRRIIFPCRDGHVAVMGVMNPREWGPMVEWLASEGMAEDLSDEVWAILAEHAGPGPLTQAAVTDEELAHVYEVLGRFFLQHTEAELSEEARRRRIILFPVLTARHLVEHPQLTARNFFRPLQHPELGETLCYPGAPYRLSKTPWQLRRRAPLIGEHNEAIYGGELGLSRAELAVLMAAGAI
ncbi:MAG TPA: CoA transferase [Candidatus Tectomicrobia bacterium]|nr:CoA transferase [Candidatus Tectomicrobia bacterium]